MSLETDILSQTYRPDVRFGTPYVQQWTNTAENLRSEYVSCLPVLTGSVNFSDGADYQGEMFQNMEHSG